ncbi:hypothetical protein ABIF93_008665 [Bradyrhizobium japonicum]
MLMPPETNSASTTRMRSPSRTSRVVTSIGLSMVGSRNMSTVSRAGTNSGPEWRSSMAKPSSPTMTRPCSDFGSQGPLATSVGWNVSPSRVKKGMFVMTRDFEETREEIKVLNP